MKIITFIIFLFLFDSTVKAIDCPSVNIGINTSTSKNLRQLEIPLMSYQCNLQSSKYKCEDFKASLSPEDQNKIIKCDLKSISESQASNLDLKECVFGTIKLKLENLANIYELPKAILESITKNIESSIECSKSYEKKVELVTLFNLGISQERHHFTKGFIEVNLNNLSCPEINNLMEIKKRAYFTDEHRRNFQHKIISKKYQIPKDALGNEEHPNYSSLLMKYLNDNKSKYECFTPKAQSEIICSVVTSFIVEAMVGYGSLKVTNVLKELVLKDFKYNAQQNLRVLSEQGNLPRKMQDIESQNEAMASRHFSSNNYKDFEYGDLAKCLNKCIDKVKDGTHFSNLYEVKNISSKINSFLDNIKKMQPGVNYLNININGEKIERIIVGKNPSAPVAIIGRGHHRVKSVQVTMNSESFSPSKTAVKLLEDQNDISLLLEENRKWIQSVKDRGMTIIDLGMGNNIEPSPFYQIELATVHKYITEK